MALALVLYGIVLWRTAWLTEDAFITFRTVDNFINGYGLTWNVAERVQAYSNPLWMLLVSACYLFTGEIYYTAVFFSIAVSLLAVVVFALRISASAPATLLAGCVLVSSKAFTDYSTSGLENPLSHLLIALFYAVYLRGGQSQRSVLWLALLGALGALNRLDLVLIFAPPLAYRAWQSGWRLAVPTLLLGSLPLVLWEVFSLFYYGFLFPNTAYAKLGTGVPMLERLGDGVGYLHNSLQLDPITLIVMIVGWTVALRQERRDQMLLVTGLAFYVAYVIGIGGGFMSGRFLAVPLWGSVLLLFHNLPFCDVKRWSATFAATLLLALLGPHPPFLTDANYHNETADDERGKMYRNAGLLNALRKSGPGAFPDHWWAVRGRKVGAGDLKPNIRGGMMEGFLIKRAEHNNTVVAAWSNVGYSGFYAGPQVHIVDALALTEPLLARMPARADAQMRAGHYERIMPAGYLKTHISGQNHIKDKSLDAYYDKLSEVIRGDLFSLRRLIAIYEINTGLYDELIDREIYRHPQPLEVALSNLRIEPANLQIQIQAGAEYMKLDEDKRAIAYFDQALALNPTGYFNFSRVGDLLFVHGHRARAKAVYRQAIRNSGLHLRRLAARADEEQVFLTYMRLVELHVKVGDEAFEQALVAIFRQILARDFLLANRELYRRMGEFFASMGLAEESVRSFQRAKSY